MPRTDHQPTGLSLKNDRGFFISSGLPVSCLRHAHASNHRRHYCMASVVRNDSRTDEWRDFFRKIGKGSRDRGKSRESLRDDRRRGFALADVYGILCVAPVTRPGPHRSEIVIGLGLIKIARIKSDAVGRFQFSMRVVSDINTATRPAFVGSLCC
jgi:hypothetical protein